MHLIGKALTSVLCAALAGAAIAQRRDAGHGQDHRTFHANGDIEYGSIEDSYTADLVLYLAGNQFMVIEELITDFQRSHPDIETVYVETIAPGQILQSQLLSQGAVAGQPTAMNPDVFASVNLDHLRTLHREGLMDRYAIYAHNKLELMVAAGNPKGIEGPADLGRDDLVQSHPNPLTEGIFRFYGSEMLRDLGLHARVTAGAQCESCWAIEGRVWFTSRHHRETPARIEKGEADVGIVWATEVAQARAEGRPIDGVAIPAPLNKQEQVDYAAGIMTNGRNATNAVRYLAYLATDEAQAIYEKYGFVRATRGELELKPL